MRETQLEDVFGISNRVNSLSYCDRGGLDARFTYLLGADRHIVVHGDSKQGKSWLREKAIRAEDTLLVQCRVDTEAAEDIFVSALGQLGVFVESARTQKIGLTGSAEAHAGTQMSLPFFKGDAGVSGAGERSKTRGMQYEPIGQNVKDLFWVAEQIRNSKKRLVVEDFHYLSEAVQRRLAFWMKALWEYQLYIIVVGIWPQEHLLTYYNGDLAGRVENVHLAWSDIELGEVLQKGCRALNIDFDALLYDALVRDAYGNVGLLQQLAEQVCLHEEIFTSHLRTHVIASEEGLEVARANVAKSMAPRFHAFADNFVGGMKRVPEGLRVYENLLRTITESSDVELLLGVDSARLLDRINQSEAATIRDTDLTQALDRLDRLQARIGIAPPVLTYNRDGRRVFLADKSFLFFRRYGNPQWPWANGRRLDLTPSREEPITLEDLYQR